MSSKRVNKSSPDNFKAENYVKHGLSRAEVHELKDAFDLLDINGKGHLDPVELKSLMDVGGVTSRSRSLELAIEAAAATHKAIDFAAFIEIFTAYSHLPKTRKACRSIFRLFDDENVGCITSKNLKRVMRELEVKMSEGEVQQMVERADANNDGVVDEEEFYQIMTRIARH